MFLKYTRAEDISDKYIIDSFLICAFEIWVNIIQNVV